MYSFYSFSLKMKVCAQKCHRCTDNIQVPVVAKYKFGESSLELKLC